MKQQEEQERQQRKKVKILYTVNNITCKRDTFTHKYISSTSSTSVHTSHISHTTNSVCVLSMFSENRGDHEEDAEERWRNEGALMDRCERLILLLK